MSRKNNRRNQTSKSSKKTHNKSRRTAAKSDPSTHAHRAAKRRAVSPPASSPPPPFPMWRDRFLESMAIQNFSRGTIQMRRAYLDRFLEWCDARGIDTFEAITREVILQYQRYLYYYRNPKTGRPVKFSTQLSLLLPIRAWFRYLVRLRVLVVNPTLEVDLPREEERLPQHVLTRDEVEAILQQPDVTTLLGLRDRAILEMLDSTAMRRSELLQLAVYDLDIGRQLVRIRQGKGARDRNVPIGPRALDWVVQYVREARPRWTDRTQTQALFVSCHGRPLGPSHLSILVRQYVQQAGIERPGSCHLFRHAVATQMLENGADMRSLQDLLGHRQITTTQIYTHVSIEHLKKVHAATHPANRPCSESATPQDRDDRG